MNAGLSFKKLPLEYETRTQEKNTLGRITGIGATSLVY